MMYKHLIWLALCVASLSIIFCHAETQSSTSTSSNTIQKLSPEDQAIMDDIIRRLALKPNSPITITVLNRNVTVSGIASDDNDAINIIANIVAIPSVYNFYFNTLKLANGNYPSRIAVAIGFAKGRMVRTHIFGNDITNPSSIPVQLTASNNIIFLDGVVDTLNMRVQSVIIAQRAALEFSPNTRVLSRLDIRSVTVKMP